MKHELRRIDPLRTANVGAVVYGLLMTVVALIVVPFILLAAVLAPPGEFGVGGAGFAVVLLVLYPVIGAVSGWVSGLLTSAIYNFVVRWTGGLLVEFDHEAVSSREAVP